MFLSIAKCVPKYIFLNKKKTKKKNKQTRRQKKANKTKEEKWISVENLMGYDDIICEFALCTFNLLDQVMNFSWLFIWIYEVYVQWDKSQYLLYYNKI